MAKTDCVDLGADRMHDCDYGIGVVAVSSTGIDVEVDRCSCITLSQFEQAPDNRHGYFVFQSAENVNVAIGLVYISGFFGSGTCFLFGHNLSQPGIEYSKRLRASVCV